MKKKKIKLKKQVYYFLAIIVALIVVGILGVNYYNDYQYQQTDEYKIIQKGYSKIEADTLLSKLSHEEITNILNMDQNPLIISFVNEKYFLYKNLPTYLEYYEDNDEESMTDIVAIVNTHANNKWYQVELETNIDDKEEMMVNKFYALSESYTPENMQVISLDYSYGSLGDNQLIDYAYDKFVDLWHAAKDAGHYLMVNSSYRDYQSQKRIYDNLKNTQGERKANEIAAKPGHSEHQTGLVVDMTSKEASSGESFTNSEAHKWLKENAHKYGFIERYPEGKTYITGYNPESWHWRYVGEYAATIMYNENITFEEYYAYYKEK